MLSGIEIFNFFVSDNLNPSKNKKLAKSWALTPKTKTDVITVATSSILPWFRRQFVTYLHTSKFCSN